MPNYLTSAYSLRIKKIFTDIKEEITERLNNKSLLKNRESILKFIIKPVKKAYTEGVRFADAYSNKIDNKTKAIISDKDKKELFEKFILRVKFAENNYKMKVDNMKKILKLEKNRDSKDSIQRDLLYNEYKNAIRTAVNEVIINAGRKGSMQVWKAL